VSALRVACVTRRFWPLVGGAETVMARLAGAFQKRGMPTVVLTAQWQRDWPRQIDHGGARVIRLPHSSVRMLGTLRYMTELGRWLRRNRREIDLVYVSMLKHDAYVAAGLGRRLGFPVVLRAEGAGLSGDCHWQLSARGGVALKRRCMRANAFVAPSRAIERELIAAGYARPRIHYVPNGVPVSEPRTSQRRREARAALAEHSRLLAAEEDAPVAVYAGRLHPAKGLVELVEAWRGVIERAPSARLWLVGEGSEADRLRSHIEARGLAGAVVLAGAFDDVGDFLAAADLFVLPSHEEGMSMALLEAMAAGLPIVASDIPGNRTLLEDGVHARLTPVGDVGSLTESIVEMLLDRELAAPLGAAARRRAETEFSLERCVERHVELFERLTSGIAD
jgi:glycosyltransferase involved in cell wall biosynthesis